jgi:type I restriction enzyme, S subunit
MRSTTIEDAQDHISEGAVRDSATNLAPPGSILAVVRSGILARTAPIAVTSVRVAFNQDIKSIEPDPAKADVWFLYWVLKAHEPVILSDGVKKGATVHSIRSGFLESLEIPLPPLDQQQRIANLVGVEMAAVERARAAAEAQLEAAKALPAAQLRSVFDGPAAQAWSRQRVSTLCKSIDYGYTASADYGALGPRYLRITDIQDGKIEWVSVPGCDIAPEDEKAKALADGDIVFAHTGATTGKSILIKRPPRAVFASYLIRLRPTDDVSPEYLYAFFQSDGYWRQVRALARGGAQPNVNATLLGSIEVPVCPRSEQERFCTEVANNEGIGGALRLAAERQLLSVDALPGALLRRAFSGEL